MKRLILLLLILVSYELSSYQRNDTYDILNKIIDSKPDWIQKQYSHKTIYSLSRLIDIASSKYEISQLELMAQIDHESGWNIYQKSYNYNSTIDYGLMQNNSDYIKERCYKVLNRNCVKDEIFDPVISMRLAFIRYDECRNYKGKSFLICYNNSDKAYLYLTSDYYPKYLEKIETIYQQYLESYK